MKRSMLKNNLWKFCLCGIVIFSIGMIIGFSVGNGTIPSLEGYLLNSISDIYGMNATGTDATSSNATSSNATSSNATSSNATSSNVMPDVIFLNGFSLQQNTVVAGSKVYVNVSTSGSCLTGMTIVLTTSGVNQTISVSLKDINNKPYFVVPSNTPAATYQIKEVLLFGAGNNGSNFSKRYSVNANDGEYYAFNSSLQVTRPISTSSENIQLNRLTLKSNSAKPGDKVYVNVSSDKTLTSLKLVFKGANGQTTSIMVTSLNNNPYFIIPTTMVAGTYDLVSATLSTSTITTVYQQEAMANQKLVVSEASKNQKNIVYNNEDITDSILSDIAGLDDDAIITINADNDPIISNDLFATIQGTSKQLVINYGENSITFKGKEVEDTLDIDVSMNIEKLSDADQDENKFISTSFKKDQMLLTFANNGELPAIAHMKIKATKKMEELWNSEPIYVYYYHEDLQKFEVIVSKLKPTKDGYYEFDITHHSKYVMSNEKLDDSMIMEPEEVNFQKGNTTQLLIIGGSIVVIALLVAFIIYQKNQKKKPINY